MLPNYFSTYCEKCGEYYRLNNCEVFTMNEALPDCEYDEESGSLAFLPGGYDEVVYIICPNKHKNEVRRKRVYLPKSLTGKPEESRVIYTDRRRLWREQ